MRSQQQQISFSQFASTIPFACRALFLAAVALWVLDFPGLTSALLVNQYSRTWSQLQLWRVLTASFCATSLFTLMLVCVNLYTVLPRLQASTSSLWVLRSFLLWGTAIQILYTLVLGVLPEGFRGYVGVGDVHGIWFYFITRYCYCNNQNKIKFMCFPFRISKAVYPPAFLLILMLLAWQVKLDAAIAIILALVQSKFVPGVVLPMSSDMCLQFMQKFRSWVPCNGFSTHPYTGLEGNQLDGKWTGVSTTSGGGSGDKVNYFNDKKGVRLSDA